MRMLDVNVLLYAHRPDANPEHEAFAAFLARVATSSEPFVVTHAVADAFVRIATNRRVFEQPSSLDDCFSFLSELLNRPNARMLGPGARHPAIFEDLCRSTKASAKLVADASHAAVAIEHGCVWVTTDSDFARFPNLRWQHPLSP